MERQLHAGAAQPITAGLITALVGFTGSFTVVLAGLRAAGADRGQAASGLLVASVLMGILGIVLSTRTRLPISIAWSTPGAALLVTTGAPRGGFGAAITAFALCGALIVLTGLWSPLRRLVLAVPRPIANALLAGVLLEICIVPVTTLAEHGWLAAGVIVTWLVLARVARRFAIPGAMAVAIAEIVGSAPHAKLSGLSLAPALYYTRPAFSVAAVTLAISLYVVTMASQNLPGIAVLEGLGYRVPLRAALLSTGGATIAGAALGGHVINLSAISAALAAGEEASPDPERRWIAAATAGGAYATMGLFATLLAALIAVAPDGLVESVAGMALIATLGASLASALAEDLSGVATYRDGAVVTFVVTASGATLAGIGSAFWGLTAGIAVHAVLHGALPRRPGLPQAG
jgi:benzoate membrane transport protein